MRGSQRRWRTNGGIEMAGACKWCPQKFCNEATVAVCKRKVQLDFYERFFKMFKSDHEYNDMDEIMKDVRENKHMLPSQGGKR